VFVVFVWWCVWCCGVLWFGLCWGGYGGGASVRWGGLGVVVGGGGWGCWCGGCVVGWVGGVGGVFVGCVGGVCGWCEGVGVRGICDCCEVCLCVCVCEGV